MTTNLATKLQTFWASEDGATVVELTVVLAATVMLVLAAMAIVSGGTEDLAGETQRAVVELDATQGFVSNQVAEVVAVPD